MNAPTKQAVLPLIGLLLVPPGACLPPLLLVAMGLAVISLIKRKDAAYAGRANLAILTLVTAPLLLLATVAVIPGVITFKRSARQSECRMNLKAAYLMEGAFKEAHHEYTTSITALEFKPEAQRRYLLRLSGTGSIGDVGVAPDHPSAPSVEQLERRLPPALLAQTGLRGTCPACELTLLCVGNIDEDDDLDVWSLSTAPRVIDGHDVPAGTVWNDLNDLSWFER